MIRTLAAAAVLLALPTAAFAQSTPPANTGPQVPVNGAAATGTGGANTTGNSAGMKKTAAKKPMAKTTAKNSKSSMKKTGTTASPQPASSMRP